MQLIKENAIGVLSTKSTMILSDKSLSDRPVVVRPAKFHESSLFICLPFLFDFFVSDAKKKI